MKMKWIWVGALMLQLSSVWASGWDPLFSSIQVLSDQVVMGDESYYFDQESILEAYGQRSKRFVAREKIYECVLKTSIAKRVSKNQIVIARTIRSKPSKSSGRLCLFAISTEGYSNPSSFEYFQLSFSEEGELIQVDQVLSGSRRLNIEFEPSFVLKPNLWEDPAIEELGLEYTNYSRQF